MLDDRRMRTTLDIDSDVLQGAKELAEHRRTTAGKILSELARNGLVRILSNLKYSPTAEPTARSVDRLRTFCSSGNHMFWPDEVSLREVEAFDAGTTVSHRQITDVYLLSLAKRHGARLATFDRTI